MTHNTTGDPPPNYNMLQLQSPVHVSAPESPTLRDQFAMAALTGLIASDTAEHHHVSVEAVAHSAYAIADAMLAARGQTGGPA